MNPWKPNEADTSRVNSAKDAILNNFLAAASDEERKLVEPLRERPLDIQLHDERLLLRLRLYTSLHGRYLTGEKISISIPIPSRALCCSTRFRLQTNKRWLTRLHHRSIRLRVMRSGKL